jgi:hypothetical protein
MTGFTILANRKAAHQETHAEALAAGLTSRGFEVSIVARGEVVHSHRVACWGWRNGIRLRTAGHDVLVMERGYLGDRFAWTSLGWNGLNNRATFGRREDGGARFRRHFGGLLKPWDPNGEYVLLIGQVPGDMSLQGRSLAGWYAEQASAARDHYRMPVLFRPHPVALERNLHRPVAGTPDLHGSLAAALRGAAAVITFNSNTAVDALLAGKPTVVADPGSMAWGVAATEFGQVTEPAREAWLEQLAWCQFEIDEIRSGFAWDVAESASPLQRAAA